VEGCSIVSGSHVRVFVDTLCVCVCVVGELVVSSCRVFSGAAAKANSEPIILHAVVSYAISCIHPHPVFIILRSPTGLVSQCSALGPLLFTSTFFCPFRSVFCALMLCSWWYLLCGCVVGCVVLLLVLSCLLNSTFVSGLVVARLVSLSCVWVWSVGVW